MTEGHAAQLVVVTTEREAAEESLAEGAVTTVKIVGDLAAGGKLLHLHYPDPQGIKADQVNFAADYCSTLLGDVAASNAFVVVYDADSRPPLDALARFEHAIATHSEASVFHQSSTFELRAAGHTRHGLAGLGRLVCDGGALRANRFVTGFEIPRLLNRSAGAPRYKRSACSYVLCPRHRTRPVRAAVRDARAAVAGAVAVGGHALELSPRHPQCPDDRDPQPRRRRGPGPASRSDSPGRSMVLRPGASLAVPA